MNIEVDDKTEGQPLVEQSIELKEIGDEVLRAIINSTRDAIIIVDSQGEIRFWNNAAVELFEWEREEVIGKKVHNLLAPKKFQDKAQEGIDLFRGTGEGEAINRTLEFEAKSKSGRNFPVELSLSAVQFDGSNGAIGIVRDISDKKQMMSELQESEERYRIMVENSPDMTLIQDSKGVVTFVSNQAESVTGYPAEHFIIQELSDYCHSDDLPYVLDVLDKALSGEIIKDFEYRFRDPSGNYRWLLHSARPIIVNEEFKGIQSTLRDITERKTIEITAQEVSQRLDKLTTFVPGMIYQFARKQDGTFSVPFTTTGIRDIFGCSPEDVIDDFSPIAKAIHPDDLTKVIESIERSARDLSEWRCEYRVTLPGKPVQWMYGQSNPEMLPDGTITWYGYNTNITERKKIMEEREAINKSRAIGVLAGGIAHDFNNMLSSILSNASLALLEAENPDQKILLDEIMVACKKAASVTGKLLTFAKGGVPSIKLHSISRIINDSLVLAIGKSSVCSVDIDMPSDIWGVEVDSGQIERVIQNLLINSKHAMPEGGIIRIDVQNIENPSIDLRGDFVQISIVDEGHGIPERIIDRIWDPYFTTKGKSGGGSGLGLSVVKSIVEKHKGRIYVESELGKGSTFVILLPGKRKETEESKMDKAIEVISSKKILVMDDDDLVIRSISHILTRLKHTVEIARNGQDALNLFLDAFESGEPFDLVILDLTIPGGIGGAKTLKRLRKIDPSIVAIVSSGFTDSIPHGFDAQLPKPYRVQDVNEAIKRALESRK